MRLQILRSLPLIVLLGCTVAKDIDYIEPGTVCEIIPWQPKWSTRANEQAELNTRDGGGVLLKSGTYVAVLGEVPPRDTRFRNTMIPQNAVRVLDGPYKDAVGVVTRPHLRVTSEPKRLDLVEAERPPAQPATPGSEASKAVSPSPKDESAAPKRPDAAQPTAKPGNAAKAASTEKAAPATVIEGDGFEALEQP
jgi:hypothetical protein